MLRKTKTPPLIWLIDVNHWERAAIRAELIEHGLEVEGFEKIFRAFLTYDLGMVERPDLIVLDIKNLSFQATELARLFGVGAPTLLLTGVYEKKPDGRWNAVLRRPFTVGQILEAARCLMTGYHSKE